MTVPTPSQVRVVRIYAVPDALSLRGGGGSFGMYWPAQNPLSSEWSWIDASGWCLDAGDTVGEVAWQVVAGDGALMVLDSGVAAGGLFAGLLITGGTPGISYIIRILLTGAFTGQQIALDVTLPITASGLNLTLGALVGRQQ